MSGRESQARQASVRAYLAAMAVSTAPPSSKLSRVGRSVAPPRLRSPLKALGTLAARPFARLQAGRLAQRSPGGLRLHLGCGPIRLPGWVNIDLFASNADLFWDITRPLPFPAGCATAIFQEQLLEHLSYTQAQAHFADCYRVLRPGGVLRIGAEAFARYAASYAGDGRYLEEMKPGRPTRLLAVAEVAYRNQHRSVWDAETLVRMLQEAGFSQAAEREFGDSAIVPAPDGAHRRQQSLYVEAVK